MLAFKQDRYRQHGTQLTCVCVWFVCVLFMLNEMVMQTYQAMIIKQKKQKSNGRQISCKSI